MSNISRKFTPNKSILLSTVAALLYLGIPSVGLAQTVVVDKGETRSDMVLDGGGTITNSGTISGGFAAINWSAFPDQKDGAVFINVINTETGIIIGDVLGLLLNSGGTVDNSGTIEGGDVGIFLKASTDDEKFTSEVSVINSGTISGRRTIMASNNVGHLVVENSGTLNGGILSRKSGGVTIVNTETGVINVVSGNAIATTSQSQADGIDFEFQAGFFDDSITNAGIINGNVVTGAGDDTVINSGTIDGNVDLGTGIGTLDNSGNIFSIGGDAVILTTGQVTNSGIISVINGENTGPAAVVFWGSNDPDQVASVINSGMIEGETRGIWSVAENTVVVNTAEGTISGGFSAIELVKGGSIDNAGTINGHILTGTGDDSLINTGIITGNILTGAGNDSLINSGTINGFIDLGIGLGTVNNSGSIVSVDNDAIRIEGGGATVINTETGIITGDNYGVNLIRGGGDARTVTGTLGNASTKFKYTGSELRDTAIIGGAGISNQLSDHLNLSVNYAGVFGSGVKNHGINVGLAYSF